MNNVSESVVTEEVYQNDTFDKLVECSDTYIGYFKDDPLYGSIATQLMSCQSAATWDLYEKIDRHGEVTNKNQLGGFHCRGKYCPICQGQKKKKVFAQSLESMPVILIRNKESKWYNLTLTVRNCLPELLGETLDMMQKGFSKFMKMKGVKKHLLGYVRVTEIDEDWNKCAHPHFHVLLHVNSSFQFNGTTDKDFLQGLWKDAIKADYDPAIDCELIVEDIRPYKETLAGALAYAFKPAPQPFSKDFLVALIEQTDGRNKYSCSGSLRGLINLGRGKRNNQSNLHQKKYKIKNYISSQPAVPARINQTLH